MQIKKRNIGLTVNDKLMRVYVAAPINFKTHYAEAFVQNLQEEDWHRLSSGAGTKGEKYDEWACIPLSYYRLEGFGRWFLLRRDWNRGERFPTISYYQVFAPKDTTLETLVGVAGQR